jgi:hypothetical protein
MHSHQNACESGPCLLMEFDVTGLECRVTCKAIPDPFAIFRPLQKHQDHDGNCDDTEGTSRQMTSHSSEFRDRFNRLNQGIYFVPIVV